MTSQTNNGSPTSLGEEVSEPESSEDNQPGARVEDGHQESQQTPGIVNIPVSVENAKAASAINYFFQVAKGTPDEDSTPQRELTSESSSSSTSSFGMLDTEDDAKLYAFVPRRLQQLSEDNTPRHGGDGRFQLQVVNQPEEGARPILNQPPPGTLLVYDSKIKGSGSFGRGYTVELKTQAVITGGTQPQFEWIHIQRSQLDFDDFKKRICSHPNLSRVEREDLDHILTKIKKDSNRERQRSRGSPINHLKNNVISRRLMVGDGATRSRFGRLFVWACIPYACLQEYVGDSPSSALSFPTVTLMQAGSAGSPKNRDMKQAVCNMTTDPAKYCYHVAQLWVVVIGDALLFTSSVMSQQDLAAKTIKITRMETDSPPRSQPQDLSLRESVRNIFVSYNGCWLWRIPLRECETWFDFVSFFREFWPKGLRFEFCGEELTSGDWDNLKRSALASNKTFTIDFTPVPPPDPIEHGVLKPLSPATSPTSDRSFHMFALGVPDSKSLLDDLKDADSYMSTGTKYTDHVAYARCRHSSRAEVHAMLLEQGSNILIGADREDGNAPKVEKKCGTGHELRIDMFNIFEEILGFFVPLTVESPTTGKFWGALYEILEQHASSSHCHPRDNKRQTAAFANLPDLLDSLSRLAQQLQTFREYLICASPAVLSGLTPPKSMYRGWILLLLGLIYGSKKGHKYRAFVQKASKAILEGILEISEALSDKTLPGREVLLPLDLVSIIVLNLAADVSRDGQQHLPTTKVYNDTVSSLEGQIWSRQSDRALDKQISYLTKEIDILFSKVLRGQIRWFEAVGQLSRNVQTQQQGQHRYHGHRGEDNREKIYNIAAHVLSRVPTVILDSSPPFASAISPLGFRGDIVSLGSIKVRDKTKALHDVQDRAIDLRVDNTNDLDISKDHQERLIFIFTVVTVVFLPLSSVAAIFGMNTSDIRDLEWGQGLFWAVALPVTVIVLLLAFAWPERLPPLSSLFSRADGAGSFYGGKPEREILHPRRHGPALAEEEIGIEPWGGHVPHHHHAWAPYPSYPMPPPPPPGPGPIPPYARQEMENWYNPGRHRTQHHRDHRTMPAPHRRRMHDVEDSDSISDADGAEVRGRPKAWSFAGSGDDRPHYYRSGAQAANLRYAHMHDRTDSETV